MAKADLLAALAGKPVEFVAGDFRCFLKPLTLADQKALNAWRSEHGTEDSYQWLFVRSVVDEAGKRVFSDKEAPTVAEFATVIVEAVVQRIVELNGMKPAPAMGNDQTQS